MGVSASLERIEKRRIVVKTAKELAGAYYEEEGKSERFRKFWPNVDQFIARNWPNFLEIARTILTGMLHESNKSIPEETKAKIFESLQADAEHTRVHPSTRIGQGAPLNLRPDQPGTLEKAIFWEK